MRTQTIMESSNVVVDDTNDLSEFFKEFFKEENISNLMESTGDEVGLVQPANTPSKCESDHCIPVATDVSVATELD